MHENRNTTEISVLKERHKSELFGLIDKNRDYLGRWLPWVEDTKTESDTEDFLSKLENIRENKLGNFFGIFVESKLVGVVGFVLEKNVAKINYWIDEDFSGRGHTTRATSKMIKRIKDRSNLDKLQISCSVKNSASIKVAKKLGFRKVSEARNDKDKVVIYQKV